MTSPTSKRQSLYEMIGAEDGLKRLVRFFYDIIEQDPEATELLLLHHRGHGVAHSRIEQFDYLSGFLGGPQYYIQTHGHSRLREIHEHVPIKAGIVDPTAELLMSHLTRAAETARNQD